MIENIDEYLKLVCKNSEKCSQCMLYHNGICFFAYECVANNFNFFKEDKRKRGK